MAASASASSAGRDMAQQMESLVQQLLAAALPPPQSSAAADGPESTGGEQLDGGMAEDDPLALPLSLCYRLTTLVQRAPSALEGARRAAVAWAAGGEALVRRCVVGLDRATQAGHELAYLFVRLLALLAWGAPEAAGLAMLHPSDAASHSNGDRDETTLLQLLTGLLRLSSAPLMLRELLDLLAALLGASELQQLRPSSSRALRLTGGAVGTGAPSPRSVCMRAFLDRNQGRNVVLLLKHVSHPLLSEESRTTLLRVLLALASTPVEAETAAHGAPARNTRSHAPHPAALARRVLDSQRDRWNETVLPPLQPASSAEPDLRVENEAQRRIQLGLIKQMRAILLVAAAPAPPASSSAPPIPMRGFGMQPQPQQRHFPAAPSRAAASSSSHWGAPIDPYAPPQATSASLYPTFSSAAASGGGLR